MTGHPEGIVLRSDRGSVRILTLNRPDSRNALDGPLHDAVLAEVDAAATSDLRALVLTGGGRAFSAGGDFGLIGQMQRDTEIRRTTLETSQLLFKALLELDIPVVAAVNGAAVGAGATLALLCDIVLMAEDAYLSEPRASIGLVAGDGGAVLWPQLAGIPAARAYLLTGDRMPAAEAYRLGLIHRCVPRAELMLEAISLAERLAAQPPYAMRATKRALNRQLEAAIQAAFAFARRAEDRSFDTPEVRDLVERRSPPSQEGEG
jgi:enoyl-CoA hydratase